MGGNQLPGVTYGEANGVRHMVDFVCAHAETFNPIWTRERARAEADNGHVVTVVEHAEVVLAEIGENHTGLRVYGDYIDHPERRVRLHGRRWRNRLRQQCGTKP